MQTLLLALHASPHDSDSMQPTFNVAEQTAKVRVPPSQLTTPSALDETVTAAWVWGPNCWVLSSSAAQASSGWIAVNTEGGAVRRQPRGSNSLSPFSQRATQHRCTRLPGYCCRSAVLQTRTLALGQRACSDAAAHVSMSTPEQGARSCQSRASTRWYHPREHPASAARRSHSASQGSSMMVNTRAASTAHREQAVDCAGRLPGFSERPSNSVMRGVDRHAWVAGCSALLFDAQQQPGKQQGRYGCLANQRHRV
jgi:hypothetical protein